MDIRIGAEDLQPEELIALYEDSGWGKALEYRPEMVKTAIEKADLVLQARVQKRLVGYLSAFSDGVSSTHLDVLLVHPAFRGRGIGTALMRTFLNHLAPTSLWVLGFEENAGFFERFGLKQRPVLRAWSASSTEWKGVVASREA
ncbi:GNAT family N-acetyltransferase [Meiothermus sp. CFH 77666]|uniref:GNAT family N-acetyltransferase n=1 Tax=Meiothermus sp. CFH 77666 TaxID=2817942 RepID=UPI001AA07504|nr:GNAT family N-acetyltransferase [Meiothermus sp. CFH 77666]MBO1438772.1 GNAT family N-acetyltransferase [Meiothermus sp. CFH 77666]